MMPDQVFVSISAYFLVFTVSDSDVISSGKASVVLQKEL